MVIRKLYLAYNLVDRMVVEMLDGRMMAFYVSPYRDITEADLKPVPGYFPVGDQADEAPWYQYWHYRLQKDYTSDGSCHTTLAESKRQRKKAGSP